MTDRPTSPADAAGPYPIDVAAPTPPRRLTPGAVPWRGRRLSCPVAAALVECDATGEEAADVYAAMHAEAQRDILRMREIALIPTMIRVSGPAPAPRFYDPPKAPRPERAITVSYGEHRIEITYSGLHHLLNCGGWGDRDTVPAYRAEDERLRAWLDGIRQQMGREDDADRKARE